MCFPKVGEELSESQRFAEHMRLPGMRDIPCLSARLEQGQPLMLVDPIGSNLAEWLPTVVPAADPRQAKGKAHRELKQQAGDEDVGHDRENQSPDGSSTVAATATGEQPTENRGEPTAGDRQLPTTIERHQDHRSVDGRGEEQGPGDGNDQEPGPETAHPLALPIEHVRSHDAGLYGAQQDQPQQHERRAEHNDVWRALPMFEESPELMEKVATEPSADPSGDDQA